MFVVKNITTIFAMPLAVAFLTASAAGLCRLSSWKRASIGLFTAAVVIAYLGSVSVVGDALLAPLESRYPPLAEGTSQPGVKFILVLGSGYMPRDGIPVTAALDEDGLTRIVEGIRIGRRLGAARIIASGGAPSGVAPSALGYAKLAVDLGVDANSLIVLDTPRDTAQEAHTVANVVGDRPFILVTSAYHMPRAMRLMESAGLHPIPAPAGYAGSSSQPMNWRRVVPGGSGLRKTERALHEYLGLLAIRLGIQ